MSWLRTYAGWRAHRGQIEAFGLLLLLMAAAWEIFFVQWNANQIAYGRYYELNSKLDYIWDMLKPRIWHIQDYPAGTLAQPDLHATLTDWNDLTRLFKPGAQEPEPPSLHSGFFKGVRVALFLIGSIFVVIAKVLIDEDNPSAPEPSAQLGPIGGGGP